VCPYLAPFLSLPDAQAGYPPFKQIQKSRCFRLAILCVYNSVNIIKKKCIQSRKCRISQYLKMRIYTVCKQVYTKCYKQCVPKETQEDEQDEGEDLCNCEFSLGYGAKILLNNTRLHLKRGKRYGLYLLDCFVLK